MAEIAATFRIPKTTGTHADVLLAVGLADLVRSLLDGPVEIRDEGASFEVRPSRPLLESDLGRAVTGPGFPFVKVNAKAEIPAGVSDFVDYAEAKERANRFREMEKAARKAKVGAEVAEMAEEDRPRHDWPLLQVLNSLQGDGPWNDVHCAIVTADPARVRAWLDAGLRALADQRPSKVDWDVSLVQLFAPHAAKGYARLKPDGTDRNDKTKEQWADPFAEWLRYRGYYRVAAPLFLSKDIRLLCPIPGRIAVSALERVTAELRREPLWGAAPKVDALAGLRLARVLIRHSDEYHSGDDEPFPGLRLRGLTPADAVSGIAITHYLSLGSSRAVSAMTTLALPGWFPLGNAEDAKVFLAILDEHERVVRALRDDHSDEIGLLIAYRRVLERRGEGARWALVEFLEKYGAHVVRAREQGGRLRQFRTDHLEKMTMSDRKLSAIMQDEGFKAVAAAVRHATVSAQALKSMGKPYREIRYDLLHELRRKRTQSDAAFLEAVSDFVASYNAENARRRETKKMAPANVTTEALESLTRLLDEWRAPTLGALLAAYGSCRVPREEEEPETAAEAA